MMSDKNNPFLLIAILFTSFTLSIACEATRESRPLYADRRLRVMVYNPNDVFKFTGYYSYQSSIIFDQDENVENISMGDTTSWQIVPNGNRIFLKPVESDATTNMTVITNQRVYYFELHAKEAKDINDPGLVFALKFIYPNEGSSNNFQKYNNIVPNEEVDQEDSNFNYNYSISGDENIAPLKIFDNGKFTFFKFKNKNADVPAFFRVNKDNSEELINYRVSGDYIVIERVSERFTLRNGSQIVCVYNDNLYNNR